MNVEALDREIIMLLRESGRAEEEVLVPLVEANCDTGEDHQLLDESGLGELLSDRMGSQCLLSFNWMSWGAPTSSSDSLWLLTMTEHHFLWLPHDFEDVHPLIILAAIPVSEGVTGIPRTVEACLEGIFNWDLMGARLPTETTNNAAHLLTEKAVKNAYRSLAQEPEVRGELLEDLASLFI